MHPRHFDAGYRERARLADGTEIALRLLRADDKAALAEGLARMSDRSRFQRFFASKTHLTQSELAYLTELDGERHFALCAVRDRADGREDGLGVARFVRLDTRADGDPTAEPAVTVIDEVQGKGLGRLLFLRLCAAARERGVLRFRTDVLVDNVAMRKLIYDLAPEVEQQVDGDVVTLDFPLPDVDVAEAPDSVSGRERNYRVLTLAAQGLVQVRRWLGLGGETGPAAASDTQADHDRKEGPDRAP
ncbi:MAG: GNAT family N-acetyltransferase [Myxococcales bacterium]|nr:GNAT family N-acetyltransferase [Myxococcales bacterium]